MLIAPNLLLGPVLPVELAEEFVRSCCKEPFHMRTLACLRKLACVRKLLVSQGPRMLSDLPCSAREVVRWSCST